MVVHVVVRPAGTIVEVVRVVASSAPFEVVVEGHDRRVLGFPRAADEPRSKYVYSYECDVIPPEIVHFVHRS